MGGSIVQTEVINPVVSGTAAPQASAATRSASEPSLLAVVTLIAWLSCVVIGSLGLIIPYARALLQTEPQLEPIKAEVIQVEVANDAVPPVKTPARLPDLMQPPRPIAPETIPPMPPMISVAAPSPDIAFAVPIPIPARLVPAKEASFRAVETLPTEVAPVPMTPQPLTFGQGEGRQPAPEYPRQALREGQEGLVTVRMTVGEDGHVIAAEAASSSPWPLLNQAALRVVRSRWRFTPGSVRAYEVAIRFQLNR